MRHGIIYTILVILGIAIVVAIFAHVGLDKIASNLQQIGIVGFLAYLGVTLLVVSLAIVGWIVILHSHNIKVSAINAAIGQLIGNAISFITPSMYIGGEPVKAHYIGDLYNTSKNKVFSTAVFAKFQELSCLIFFIYLGTLIMIIRAKDLALPAGIWTVLLIVDIILGVLVIFIIRSIIKNSPIVSDIAHWIARRGIFRKHIEKIIPKLLEVEETIYVVFRHDWKKAMIAYAFNFLSLTFAFIKPAVFFYFLYRYTNILTWTDIAVIFTLSQVLLVFQFTPGCLGIFEGGQVAIFQLLNISIGDAASYVLIYRFVDLLITGTGIYLALHYGLLRIVGKRLEPVKNIDDNNKEVSVPVTTVSPEKNQDE